MRRDELRLRDMLERIDSALLRVADEALTDFLTNPDLQKLVQYDLLIIGEAASNVSAELRTRYPEVPWKEICGLRNILVHQYFSVDLDIVRQTVAIRLDPLRVQIEQILRAEFPGGLPPSRQLP